MTPSRFGGVQKPVISLTTPTINSSTTMSTAHSSWSREDITVLIDCYRQYPCLWNPKLVSYKNRQHRDDAFKKIGAQFPNHSISIIKGKIQTLRGQYRKELAAFKKSMKSGAGTDDIYTPKLWCFSLLSFLHDDTICATVSSLPQVSH